MQNRYTKNSLQMYTLAYSTNISMQAHESNIKDPEKKSTGRKMGNWFFLKWKRCAILKYTSKLLE